MSSWTCCTDRNHPNVPSARSLRRHAKRCHDAGSGPNPTLPPPDKQAIPTVNIAPAKGWAAMQTPAAAAGFAVASSPPISIIRAGSTCCRTATCWSPKPTRRRTPEDGKGIKGWVMKKVHDEGRRRRAERRTASRCCATPTATASPRRARVFLDGSEFAVRHGAGRQRLLRRQHRRGRALPVSRRRDRRSRRRATKVADLPAGPHQPSLDQEPHRQPRRHAAVRRPSARTATSPRTAWRTRSGRAAILEIDPATGAIARVRVRPAQSRTAWPGSRRPARCGPSSTSATSSAATSCPTT